MDNEQPQLDIGGVDLALHLTGYEVNKDSAGYAGLLEVLRIRKMLKRMGVSAPRKLTLVTQRLVREAGQDEATPRGLTPEIPTNDLTVPFPKGHIMWYHRWNSFMTNEWRSNRCLTEGEQEAIVGNVDFQHILEHATPKEVKCALGQPIPIRDEEQMFLALRKIAPVMTGDFKIHPRNLHCFTWNNIFRLTPKQTVDILDSLIKFPPAGEFPAEKINAVLFPIVLKGDTNQRKNRKARKEYYDAVFYLIGNPERYRQFRLVMEYSQYLPLVIWDWADQKVKLPEGLAAILRDSIENSWNDSSIIGKAKIVRLLEQFPAARAEDALLRTGKLDLTEAAPKEPVPA